ncbi:hypothetical protein L916_17453 [Phytophthora nicotianae]|uniref:Ankyrin repeat-containing domain n=1 Tax=Phytophthora nicotianae TaxID=4792 RepID=W2I4Z8_PHYNI|nr:hypothetical protein L916_17453 [Phytophthora nicotianae]
MSLMHPDTSDSFLTSVRVVCRSQPRINVLNHVLQQLDAFLFPSQAFTLPRCVQHGNIRLFRRVLVTLDNDNTRCQFEKIQQYRLAMQAAAKLGHLWMVQQLYQRYPVALSGATALAAGQSGRLPLIQWVYETKRHLLNMNFYAAVYKAFETSASRGDLHTVQWLVKNFSNVVFDIGIPAKEGQLEVAKWVLEEGKYRCRFDVVDEVAVRGDLNMMQFLVNRALLDGPSSAPDLAAEFGHIELVKWLSENESKHSWSFTTTAMVCAAKNGHLEVVKWLHENRKVGCTTNALDLAAGSGHLSVLQWLYANRHERCTANAMDNAAMTGYLKVVQWLHNEGARCTTAAINHAAHKNHLNVVQWLHETRDEGCTAEAMDWASKAGHLAMVKWLHVNRREGCTTFAMDQASANGH